MAKKRKREKVEEEYEFRPPDFDEEEFLKKELRDTRTILFTVGYAALFGLVAGIVSLLDTDLIPFGLALLVAGIYSLKFVYPMVSVNVEEFTKKNWAGNVAWFFFTFLAVWVLMFNYPISDHADPTVTDVQVWVTNEITGNVTVIDYKYVEGHAQYEWIPRFGEDIGSIIHSNASYRVNISAKVADNGELRTARLALSSAAAVYQDMTAEGDSRYGYELSDAEVEGLDSLMFYIQAEDAAGNDTQFSPRVSLQVAP